MRLKLHDVKTAYGELARYRQLKKGDYIFVPGVNGAMVMCVFGCKELQGISFDKEVEYRLTPNAAFGPGVFYFCLDIATRKQTVKLAFEYGTHGENLFGLAFCSVMFLAAGARPDSLKNNTPVPANELLRLFRKGALAVEIPSVKQNILDVLKPLAAAHELLSSLAAGAGTLH